MAKKKSTSKTVKEVETVENDSEQEVVVKDEETVEEVSVPKILLKELPQAAYDAVRSLTGLEHLEATMFSTDVTENNEIVRVPVVTGPVTDKGYVVVSTFGLGEVETEATATIDGKDYLVHLELYTIADSVENAKPMAEELAKLAFFVDAKKQPLLPGLVLNQPDGTAYMFSEKPLGVAHDVTYHNPIVAEELLVSFVFCYKITSGEAELLQSPDTAEKFLTYVNSLGNKAYGLNREEFTLN